MPIRSLDSKTVAHGRLNALRFTAPVAEAARALANWQVDQGGLLVPMAMPLPKATEGSPKGVSFFRHRAKLVRAQIAQELGLVGDAALKLSFTMTWKDAWYLGPRPKLDAQSMLDAVAASPAKFIELMLLKELIESSAIDAEDTFVGGGFGPGVYLGSASQASKRHLQLAEVEYTVNSKHGFLLCDMTAKRFSRKLKTSAENASATRLANAGEGFLVGVTRIVPDDFHEQDGRKFPMDGLSLDLNKVRRTRFYYLNLLTEFAMRLFTKARVPFARETFAATHFVDDAYIPLEPLAQLKHPIIVVNTTKEPLDHDALAPLVRFPEYLPGYHVAGNKKVHFPAPDVRAVSVVPEQLDSAVNYLFLNGKGDDESGSVRLAKGGSTESQAVTPLVAYLALSKGEGRTDPYTEVKYRHLLAQDRFKVSTQGLDYGPNSLALLRPGKAGGGENRQLQEALKRCLVEMSLKEALLGHKAIAVPAIPDSIPVHLTLLATRRARMPGRAAPEQSIAAVDVRVEGSSIEVIRVRRTPWGSGEAVLDFVFEYEFLREQGKDVIRDGQFWVLDPSSGERLTVWAGTFVPKIILSDAYEGIEHAIGVQDSYLAARREEGSKGKYLSKGREFNLLPYYISMFKPEHSVRGERIGSKMPIQDCGAFIRIFVPPEGGIAGSGDAMSGMRDLMHYGADGAPTRAGLLDLPLVQLYLHTMTNGVLVGGGNSKMSVLEKLARLALEN
ncbi:hypothetical protein BW21_4998 [Burkholderia humptydooensis]|nr:hypothetical protein BW21_4998 [Burkholderia sp. 2002721687]EIP84470.1 hypothetical protein A33K_18913 [Burkholderia humptydooensis MSMB43]